MKVWHLQISCHNSDTFITDFLFAEDNPPSMDVVKFIFVKSLSEWTKEYPDFIEAEWGKIYEQLSQNQSYENYEAYEYCDRVTLKLVDIIERIIS